MSRLFHFAFAVGLCGFVLFAGSATLGSLSDFGVSIGDERMHRLMRIFSIGGAVFVLCGFVLLLETISYVRTNWHSFSAFGKFLGTFGLLVGNILSGYIFHLFFVVARSRAKDEY